MENFEQLFEQYYKDVYRFLLRLCGFQESLAEEYTQETFFCAYLSFPDFRGGCQLKTWLIQIAKNRFYLGLRKKKGRTVSINDLFPEPHATEEMEDRLDERLLLEHSRGIIDSLPVPMRDVMLYRIFSDLSYRQIACLLGISENSAKVLFFRGKKILRAKLKEEYGYEI